MTRSLLTPPADRVQIREAQNATDSKPTTTEAVAMHRNLVQSQDRRLLRCSCCLRKCNANLTIHKATEDESSYAHRTLPGTSKTFKRGELPIVPVTGLQAVDQNKELACHRLMKLPKDWVVAVIPKTWPSLSDDLERSRESNSRPKSSKSVGCRWPDAHLRH